MIDFRTHQRQQKLLLHRLFIFSLSLSDCYLVMKLLVCTFALLLASISPVESSIDSVMVRCIAPEEVVASTVDKVCKPISADLEAILIDEFCKAYKSLGLDCPSDWTSFLDQEYVDVMLTNANAQVSAASILPDAEVAVARASPIPPAWVVDVQLPGRGPGCDYYCPAHSTEIPNRYCYDTIDDCVCNSGYTKSMAGAYGCVPASGPGRGGYCTYKCPANSKEKPGRYV